MSAPRRVLDATIPVEPDSQDEIRRLTRRIERERLARQEAELVAERGLRDLYKQQLQLQLLEKIATAANQTSSVEEVLAFAVSEVCQFTKWSVGHVWLPHTQIPKTLFSASIWYERDAARNTPFRVTTGSTLLSVGIGLPGRVFETASPSWIFDVAADGNFPRYAAAAASGLKAACAFPVLVGDEVTAVLEFLTEEALTADAALLRVMSQIGTQLGRVIERKRAEERLLYEASHDALTGLPNRALFVDRLAQTVARYHRRQIGFAVLFIDLDGFKVVNDGLGHLAGDKLLIQVAEQLAKALREGDHVSRLRSAEGGQEEDTLARLGGDEFTVLLNDIGNPSDAARVADRLQKIFKTPFDLDGQHVFVSASIGIAIGSSGYLAGDEVLRDADLAMYRAKSRGKARSEMFDQAMHEAAVKRLRLETDLRHAVQNQEFVIHYQPIVGLETGDIAGFEALVRWQKPGVDLVYPNDFIQVTEETGLIIPLGEWVLTEACRTVHAWQRDFPQNTPLSVSVNVSARQFEDATLLARVKRVLAETRFDLRYLRLEITESVTIKDPERTVVVLRELQELGVQVSLDDFGTGYSSLSYLHRFPVDVLKIDRSFVSGLSSDVESQQIVQAIISLARHLNMKVVAEGTETNAHVDTLRSLGCDFGQGYVFARPADERSVRDFLLNRLPALPIAV